LMKIFPGQSLGADYIKELRGPLGHIPMMPTGGVDLGNVGSFIRNGAVAVGVGGSLMNRQAIAEERYEILTELAQKFTAAIQLARKENESHENHKN
jgi:2-dehydro-3-deoxyphosphogluconate aldolase/(4S)-4-hydroxy-2-oxoglutarate aldolase